jgi:hypothetical protein
MWNDLQQHMQRLGAWWLMTALALIVVVLVAPHQTGVLVYKVCQVTMAILLTYGADRALFRYAPGITADMPRDTMSAARVLARAIVALAIIIGLTVGI